MLGAERGGQGRGGWLREACARGGCWEGWEGEGEEQLRLREGEAPLLPSPSQRLPAARLIVRLGSALVAAPVAPFAAEPRPISRSERLAPAAAPAGSMPAAPLAGAEPRVRGGVAGDGELDAGLAGACGGACAGSAEGLEAPRRGPSTAAPPLPPAPLPRPPPLLPAARSPSGRRHASSRWAAPGTCRASRSCVFSSTGATSLASR